jgi:hypothetical protein
LPAANARIDVAAQRQNLKIGPTGKQPCARRRTLDVPTRAVR